MAKKFGKKAATKDWQKNFGECWLVSPIANKQLTVKRSQRIKAIPKP